MNETPRRKSKGVSAPPRVARKTDRRTRRAPAEAGPPDRPREEASPESYRPELVARLEQAVREGRYRPDSKAIAAAMVDRMDAI